VIRWRSHRAFSRAPLMITLLSIPLLGEKGRTAEAAADERGFAGVRGG